MMLVINKSMDLERLFGKIGKSKGKVIMETKRGSCYDLKDEVGQDKLRYEIGANGKAKVFVFEVEDWFRVVGGVI